MIKMLDISWSFKLVRKEIQFNLFRKLVDIKIFHIRRNIMPKNWSHIGYMRPKSLRAAKAALRSASGHRILEEGLDGYRESRVSTKFCGIPSSIDSHLWRNLFTSRLNLSRDKCMPLPQWSKLQSVVWSRHIRGLPCSSNMAAGTLELTLAIYSTGYLNRTKKDLQKHCSQYLNT